jgi:DNA repair protein RecN (Recombination protein N)
MTITKFFEINFTGAAETGNRWPTCETFVLTQLHVHNLAVVDAVDVDFGTGFTALTGETGAGKSILVDALALALGERADSNAIRTGTDRCEISATFNLSQRPDLLAWLSNNDLDEEDECIVRRIVTSEGRSRGYINGHTVPMQTLRELGDQLIDICGQQSHQSLRRPEMQRRILDQYGNHDALLADMSQSCERWQTAQTELNALNLAQSDKTERQALLSYQVSELHALNIYEGEMEALTGQHLRMSNSHRISDGLTSALQQLYEADTGTAYSLISSAKGQLDSLSALDAEFKSTSDLLSESQILVTEVAEALRRYLSALENDPQQLEKLEQRIGVFQELARKHRVVPEDLFGLIQKLELELADIQGTDERLAELSKQEAQLNEAMHSAARALTDARNRTAIKLGDEVTENMQKLGMPGGTFAIDILARPDNGITPTGADRIEFIAGANVGQKPGPLTQVASGGELSRLSLALQVVAIATDAVPTLIFDEVDSGVGGGVAEIVGSRLRELSQQRQVLCVTHLAQVGSQADHHFRVTKISDGISTRTSINGLTHPERIEEIARMLGGVEITARTRAHAAEMLKGSTLKSSAG